MFTAFVVAIGITFCWSALSNLLETNKKTNEKLDTLIFLLERQVNKE